MNNVLNRMTAMLIVFACSGAFAETVVFQGLLDQIIGGRNVGSRYAEIVNKSQLPLPPVGQTYSGYVLRLFSPSRTTMSFNGTLTGALGYYVFRGSVPGVLLRDSVYLEIRNPSYMTWTMPGTPGPVPPGEYDSNNTHGSEYLGAALYCRWVGELY